MYFRWVRIILRVVYDKDAPVGQVEAVLDARHGHDDGLVELPFQPLLNDLKVQKAQEPAAEALAQRSGRILLVRKGCVVQLIFLQRLQERLVVVRCDRIDGREDDRLHFLEAGQGFLNRVRVVGNSIADPGVAHRFDP